MCFAVTALQVSTQDTHKINVRYNICVIAIPNESSIKSASKIQLLELRQLLTDYIDELVESM